MRYQRSNNAFGYSLKKRNSILTTIYLILSLGSLFTTIDCAPKLVPQPPAKTVLPGEEVLQKLQTEVNKIISLKGHAEIYLKVKKVKQRADADIFFKQPDKLRLEVNSFFGINLLTAVAQNGHVTAYLPMNQQRMEVDEGNFSENMLGLRLNSTDLKDMILGTLTPTKDDILTDFSTDKDNIFLIISRGELTSKVRLAKENLKVISQELYDRSGAVIGKRILSNYEKVDGISLPALIKTYWSDSEMSVKFDERRVNLGLPDSTFELESR